MSRITWSQYWDGLRSAWIVDFHRDLLKYWLKETDWVEILLLVLTPAICLAIWITIPISYPLLTYIKLSMAKEKEQNAQEGGMKHTRESLIAFINECRKNGTRIDLSGLDMGGLDMSGLDLRGALVQNSNLQGTNLYGANLYGANLRGSNLREANLRRTILDYTGYELSCKTIGIKADKRLVSHLLYHLCSMDVSGCPEWDKLRNDERLIALANKSHVIREHGLPEIKQTNAQEEK